MQIKDHLPQVQPELNSTNNLVTITSVQSESLTIYKMAKKSLPVGQAKASVVVEKLQAGLFKLGIKTPPTVEEWAMYVKELVTYHNRLTIGEIELAFTLTVRNELNFEYEHYQNFSLMYFNKMLAAYKQWAIKQHREIEQKESAPIEVWCFDRILKTMPELEKEINQGFEDFKNQVINNASFIPPEWWFYLHNCGVLENLWNFRNIDNKLIKDCEPWERKQLKEMSMLVYYYFDRLNKAGKTKVF